MLFERLPRNLTVFWPFYEHVNESVSSPSGVFHSHTPNDTALPGSLPAHISLPHCEVLQNLGFCFL